VTEEWWKQALDRQGTLLLGKEKCHIFPTAFLCVSSLCELCKYVLSAVFVLSSV
jgi:hypothetical protein